MRFTFWEWTPSERDAWEAAGVAQVGDAALRAWVEAIWRRLAWRKA